MQIRFFGHNCFLICNENVCILTDPWLSSRGAFFGSWFQWPLNHHLIEPLKNELKCHSKVVLYISHEHQDHFDEETLQEIRPFVSECLIPKYSDDYLDRRLQTLGYETQSMPDMERFYFNAHDYIELLIVDTGVNHDSTAIIKLSHEFFVNQNDCKIFDRLPSLGDVGVKYYSVQFSGATWHPACYEMDGEEKKKVAQKKVLSKLAAIKGAIRQLKPEYYFPAAGPAVFPFLNHELSRGSDNIFIHQPTLQSLLSKSKTELVFLKPGQWFEPEKHTTPILAPSDADLTKLERELKCSFLTVSDEVVDKAALRKQIELRLKEIENLCFEECPLLIFKWEGDGFAIDLNAASVSELVSVNLKNIPKFMQVSASKHYFNLMANSQNRWQDIYLSLRASVKRDPDIFNTFINIFLFSDVSNIRSGFETTLNINDEKMVVVNPHNGKNYEVNRYCPHNGADLKDAQIDVDGNLICPRHNWLFNLNDDGKCKATDSSINAKEIINTITLCEGISARLVQ